MFTDRSLGWHPLEAAPSPSVPLSPLDDISLVVGGGGGGGCRGGRYQALLEGAVYLCVAWTKVNTVLMEVNTVLKFENLNLLGQT